MASKKHTPDKITIVAFPLMEFKQIYKLSFGEIGQMDNLFEQEIPQEVQSYFKNRFTINDKKIIYPTIAISNKSEQFLLELEIISFLYHSDWANSDSHIFGQRFQVGEIMRRNERSNFYKLELDMPFEDRFKSILKSDYFKSLINLIQSESNDIEFNKERQRILIAMRLFNEVQIGVDIINPFAQTKIILITAAFEALLNLPQEAKTAMFIHSITSLIGPKSSLLTEWCKSFYNYRSSLVHGDIAWRDDTKDQFKISGKDGPAHRYIAHQVFVECIKVKLFLMGVHPNYDRKFHFENFITTWIDNANQDHHTYQSKIVR